MFNLSNSQMRVARRSDREAQINLSKRRAWFVETSAGFANLVDLDPVLTEIFYQKYRQMTPLLLGNIFGVRVSSKAKETHGRVGSFGDPQPWEGQIHYDDASPDYEIEWSHGKLSLGFKVEKELIDDMQYQGIFDSASNLGQSFNRKVVKDEAAVLNSAFATVTGYDGKVLCATDHPRSQTDSTAVSNSMGTAALTESNLEAAIIQLEGLGDDLGNETVAIATHLVVGRQQRSKAYKLTGSTQEPESGNNAINPPNHTILKPIVHPLITGNKWFVVDAGMSMMQMLWYWRQQAEFGSDDDKSKTQIRSYFGTMRYSKGWQDFRWLVGSNAA